MAGSQHFSPGDIQFQIVYERGPCAESSYLKVTPTSCLFTKLAKSHISAQFFVRVFVLGWYTYFESAQVLFSLCFREKRVETLRIYE